MGYRIRVERMDEAGIPAGPPRVYEAVDEAGAITIATRKVAMGRVERPGIATVSDPSGRVLFVYTGRIG
jgi:hypothetical protein